MVSVSGSAAIKMVILIFILRIEAQVLATTSTSCPSANHYWNGSSCTSCTKCRPGYGVKTKCSEKQDTECQECWPGYDWSNNTSLEPCMDCVSECPEGNFKIRNCTTTSPTICKGCAEEHYFHPGNGEHGGCVPCSQPCGISYLETRQCKTAHDRICTARNPRNRLRRSQQCRVQDIPCSMCINPENRMLTLPIGQEISLSCKRRSAVVWKCNPGGWVTSFPFERKGTPEPPKTTSPTTTTTSSGTPPPSTGTSTPEVPIRKQTWFWVVVVGVPVALVTSVVAVLGLVKWNKRRNRINNQNDNNVAKQRIPLKPRGLDTLVRDLTVEDRKFISQQLNVEDPEGYAYWLKVGEKLRLEDQCRQWRRSGVRNPTDNLLTAFAEKRESTIRKLIEASEEAGLTLFASELENRFSPGAPNLNFRKISFRKTI